MVEIRFGLNLNFATKRWPEPTRWAEIARDAGVSVVQFSFDLCDPAGEDTTPFDTIREDAAAHGVEITSAFTGLAQYSQNLLAHPDLQLRTRAEAWYEQAIVAGVHLGASSVGGHMGALSVHQAADPKIRRATIDAVIAAVLRLAQRGREEGLDALLWEVMAVQREWPVTMREVQEMLDRCEGSAIPVELCLDLGHAVLPSASGQERDPYAWLERFADRTRCLHLQQTDGVLDRHWPFTDETNAKGIIDPERVMGVLTRCGRSAIELMLEPAHPVELPDDQVLAEIRSSVDAWVLPIERFRFGETTAS